MIPNNPSQRSPWTVLAIFMGSMLMAACGGSGGTTDTTTPPPLAQSCDPADPATADQCGTLMLALTDADGDFSSYTIDVVSIELEKANGAVVETLPASTRVDFAQYVDLTELVTLAAIPPGTYVSGSITLDYSAAEVFVEAGDAIKEATVVGGDGAPLDRTTLSIRLSDRDHLNVLRGRASLMTLDFDLDASHTVDIDPTPAIAVAEPFIVAEIEPVDMKELRVRGLFVEADESAMTYTIALRPFHDRAHDFGRHVVHVTDDTGFEVDGESFTGLEGLRALSAAGPGTLTVAWGTLNVAEREFTASHVLAGSSVPGFDRDAIQGSVIARDGNLLQVHGVTIYRPGMQPWFRGEVSVTIGDGTRVVKVGQDVSPGIEAISVGQNVTIAGNLSITDSGAAMDATDGAVRMNVTRLLGSLSSIVPGQIEMQLHAIDRRRVSLYDFSGTGMTADLDADPDHYEVATGLLSPAIDAVSLPVKVFGFPTAFGMAPPDFEGRTIVDFTTLRSALGVGWGVAGTAAPFLAIGSEGLVLDNGNPDIDQRHYIKQGMVLIDLTALDSGTQIVPAVNRFTVFAIKTGDSLQLWRNFAEFSDELARELGAGSRARAMHAYGIYDRSANVFTAHKIGIHLLAP